MLFLISVAASLSFGHLLLRFERVLTSLSIGRGDQYARQSSHVGDPPRVGGVAVLAGLVLGLCLAGPSERGSFIPVLLLSSLPVLIAGLAEDLGRRVSPLGRLLAAALSALLAIVLLETWIPRGDLAGLNWLLAIPAAAMVLTAIHSSVFCHAVNLIDGMNGLAGMVITTAALGFAVVAALVGDSEIMLFSTLLAASTAGFLILNWPVARLFLGDAGAYGLGHLLVWQMILLISRVDTVAVPALMLVLFWPLADVFHTVGRRIINRTSIMEPDRLHLHQKVRRVLDIVWFGYRGRSRSNPLTTLCLLPMITAPVITGVVLWDKPTAAWSALAVFLGLFTLSHPLVTLIAVRFRR